MLGCYAADVAAAQLRLGVMHENGIGMRVNYKVQQHEVAVSLHPQDLWPITVLHIQGKAVIQYEGGF